MRLKHANLNSELDIDNDSAATSIQVSENCQIPVCLHICILDLFRNTLHAGVRKQTHSWTHSEECFTQIHTLRHSSHNYTHSEAHFTQVNIYSVKQFTLLSTHSEAHFTQQKCEALSQTWTNSHVELSGKRKTGFLFHVLSTLWVSHSVWTSLRVTRLNGV